MQQACIAIIIILLTVAAYLAMVKLYKRFPLPFLIPVLTTTILIVAVLMMFHVSYEGYFRRRPGRIMHGNDQRADLRRSIRD